MKPQPHPLATAIQPLVDAIGGLVISPEEIEDGDIGLDWEGDRVVGVRLIDIVSLERLIATIEEQLGSPLAELSRVDKQKAVRMLEERGAFRLRRSIEEVGIVMGVSRITIYNYLNATRADG